MSKPRHALRRRRDQIELAVFTGAPVAEAEVGRELAALADEVGGGEPARLEALAQLAAGRGDRAAYLAEHGAAGVRRFRSAGDATIYLMRVETFPDHVNNVYLVRQGGRDTLFDCGAQTASSREDLERAERVLREVYGEGEGLSSIGDLILSHAHIDHFGGVGAWRARGARVHVHELDARVITCFEERIITAALQIRIFLERAGIAQSLRTELERMYGFGKQLFSSVPVDRTLVDGDQVNGWKLHHVPGHCPGQMCLQVDEVLLTTDHVLGRITPHQSPESITPWTGLDHYFQSLDKIRRLPGIALALPGHEEPILDVGARIDEIEAFHRQRLGQVRQICAEPRTTAQVAVTLFGEQQGYGRLLALEEAAAHIEYLSRRGSLRIDNLAELEREPNPVLRYRAVG